MEGRARAPGAGTILNALATGVGSAFAIEQYTHAHVSLSSDSAVQGTIAGAPDADTRLIERCVELVVERFGDDEGGEVRTESDLPMAGGLKSSSAAANATVLATMSALGVADQVDREEAARMGVTAARDAGVTVTGAFDDASASMLGGITITDNTCDELRQRARRDWHVLVWIPPERAYSADADLDRCRRLASLADLVAELALDGAYTRAMTVNGLAFCAALKFDAEPMLEAMPDAAGVSLSGTGPSFIAVGDRDALASVKVSWDERAGQTVLTTTQTEGATIDE